MYRFSRRDPAAAAQPAPLQMLARIAAVQAQARRHAVWGHFRRRARAAWSYILLPGLAIAFVIALLLRH